MSLLCLWERGKDKGKVNNFRLSSPIKICFPSYYFWELLCHWLIKDCSDNYWLTTWWNVESWRLRYSGCIRSKLSSSHLFKLKDMFSVWSTTISMAEILDYSRKSELNKSVQFFISGSWLEKKVDIFLQSPATVTLLLWCTETLR